MTGNVENLITGTDCADCTDCLYTKDRDEGEFEADIWYSSDGRHKVECADCLDGEDKRDGLDSLVKSAYGAGLESFADIATIVNHVERKVSVGIVKFADRMDCAKNAVCSKNA